MVLGVAGLGLARVLGAARGSQSRFFEEASSGIIGQEFSAGSSRIHWIHYFPLLSTGNGVRSCGSDPAFHAQESQDDVSSQANSLKLALERANRGAPMGPQGAPLLAF